MLRRLALAAWAILTLPLSLPGRGAAQAPLVTVQYPDEGYALPYAKGTFLLGVATPTGGLLTINGSSVAQHADGGYLAFVPVDPGSFTFHLEYRVGASSAAYDRRVSVGKPLTPSPPEPLAVDPEYTRPDGDVALQPGDWLYTQVKGTPLTRAKVKVEGVTGWLPMLESTAAAPGLYQAAIPVTEGFRADRARVRFRLKRGFWSSVSAQAPGSVSAPAPLRVVETSTDTAYVRTGPERGYMLFPLLGTRFVSDGRLKTQQRLRLSAAESGWAYAGSLRELPEGTPPPEAVLSAVRTQFLGPRETWVRLDLSELVPAEVLEEGEWLRLRLHHTVGHNNWIVYDSSDTYVREVQWRQEDSRTVELRVRLDAAVPLWGWRLAWEPGQLVLILRRPPAPELWSASPLKGLSIVLDPGHSPGKKEGAVGPLGTRESEVNMTVALELKSLLEADGASVLLTREGLEEKALVERPRLAWEKRGDLFVSIHNNALPDGVNPFAAPRGFMVFYYHPHSLAFARAMHKSYAKASPVIDEGLRYGNLLVARESGMPAILTESDYLMFPERELRLLSPDYQKALAKIHRDGILNFLKPFSKPEPARKAGPPEPSKEKR